MRLPWAKKPARPSESDAAAAVQRGPLPAFFCFGCRLIISERPCDACDRETEIFEVTTEIDRRVLVNRLALEGER